eukprot:6207605-Pleurochrysis_carterae.AAC.1
MQPRSSEHLFLGRGTSPHERGGDFPNKGVGPKILLYNISFQAHGSIDGKTVFWDIKQRTNGQYSKVIIANIRNDSGKCPHAILNRGNLRKAVLLKRDASLLSQNEAISDLHSLAHSAQRAANSTVGGWQLLNTNRASPQNGLRWRSCETSRRLFKVLVGLRCDTNGFIHRLQKQAQLPKACRPLH